MIGSGIAGVLFAGMVWLLVEIAEELESSHHDDTPKATGVTLEP
jgi:hypothetical protein